MTPLGREQAGRTGRWLGGVGFGAVVTGPLRRARQTAELIADDLPVRTDDRLRERMDRDGAVPARLLQDGVPPCAITVLDGGSVRRPRPAVHGPPGCQW